MGVAHGSAMRVLNIIILSLWCTAVYCSGHRDKEYTQEVANTTVVQWYRTAQDTSDRLTSQPDVQFGADFSSDAVIYINR